MFKLDLEKRNQRSNCQHLLDHRKSKRNSRKTSTSLLTTLKPLTVWITTNSGKFLKRWEYQLILSASCETWMYVKKQQLKLDMEKWTGSKLRSVQQGCILLPCLFNLYAEYIMRNAGQDEAELESRLPGEISITSNIQMTPPWWQKVKRNYRASWWKWKRRMNKLA